MEQLLKPSTWRACTAPWRYVFRPARAVQETSYAPRAAGWVTLFAASILTTAVVLVAITWSEATRVEFRDDEIDLVHRPWTEFWTHRDGLPGPGWTVRIALMFVLIGFMTVFALGAALLLPLTAGSDGFRASVRRACCLAYSGLGAAALMAAASALFVAWVDNLNDARQIAQNAVVWSGISEIAGSTVWRTALCALLGWWAIASLAVALPRRSEDLSPHCEECGYDLTHQPANWRCPECGASLDETLTEHIARPGPAWRRGQPHVENWLETTRELLLQPRRAYRRMAVYRRESRDVWFSAIHFVLIGVLCACASLCISLRSVIDPPTTMFATVLAIATSILMVWLTLRGTALLATLWSLYGGFFDRPALLWTIARYETATVWYYVLFHGPIIVLNQLYLGPFSSSGMLSRGMATISTSIPEIQAAGHLGIMLFCVWRYRIAAKAVRWSRF